MITLTQEDIKCLREHLNSINMLLMKAVIGGDKPPKTPPKQSKKEKTDNYKQMLTSTAAYRKPEHLKKKK